MASGRMLSPDFWTDAAMIELPIPVRLFYIGTWNFACSAGHIKDDPLQIRLQVLPADNIDGAGFVQQLVDSGRMVRFSLRDGSRWLLIRRMARWQKQDKRFQSRCPACREHDDSPGRVGENSESPQLSAQGGGGVGLGDKGEEESASAHTPRCPKHPDDTDRPCLACKNARLAYEAWESEQKRRRSTVPDIRRPETCTIHAEYVLPCNRCKEGT